MTGFILKIIAVITMFLDHIKYAAPITNCFLTKYFGRIAFPIFAFLITEGLTHTKSKKKYILRMFIFACISQIPFMMFRSLVADKFLINIMFTFLFAILGICIVEKIGEVDALSKFFKIVIDFFVLFTILIFGSAIPVDYGWFGILAVWIFYAFRENKILRTLNYTILVILYYLSSYMPNIQNIPIFSVIFTILPGYIILLYNGKEGRKVKYFFYWFYPIHMALIYLISKF